MCGILGIINIDNKSPFEEKVLSGMADTMKHRGPDGAGIWQSEDFMCNLAHRRLSILDLSDAGKQPMSTADQAVCITFNGEIYNYPSLRKNLEAKNYSFRSSSDTEVILYLYKEYGSQFYKYLDGDFGIGLWDAKEKKIIIARDQAGVKPVYYTYFDGRFIFASEIKAILKYPGIDKSIDTKSFYDYLTFLVVPPPKTLIKGISKLECASTLTLKPQEGYKPVIEKYWQPFPQVHNNTNFNDLDRELEDLFNKSVRKRLQADVPVGVLFSGGVDSTLNLCSFGELTAPEKVKTFTVGMENRGELHDDSIIARKMSSLLGSNHYEIRITEEDMLQTTEKLAILQDEPISDPVAVPLYFITKYAKECGVTVLQAGEGADELFCGYDNYRRFINHNKKLWKPLNAFPRCISKMGAALLSFNQSPKKRKIRDVLRRHSMGQEFFMSSAVAYYELEKQRILSKDFKQIMKNQDSYNAVKHYYDTIQSHCPDASFLQKITFIELQLRLPELLLMRTDKMAMANSVEIRVPFLDRDLMNFSMKVPDHYKLRNGVSKEPIKKLATKYVSREDVYRPKTGFGAPIQQWFKGELGASLRDLLKTDCELNLLIDTKQVSNHLENGLRTVNEAFQLWVIYNILVWHKGLISK